MSLEIPKFHFDLNLHEVPDSPEEFLKFIAQCRSELAHPSPEDRKSVLAKIGFALRVTRQLYEAEKVFKEAIGLCSISNVGPLINAKIRLAHVYQWEFRFDLSNEIFEDLEKLYLSKTVSNSIKGTYWQHRGKNEFDQKNYSRALMYFEKALSIREGDSAPSDQIESSQFAIQQTKELLSPKGSSLKRQIIAIGGGGFSMEIDNPLLDLYVLKAAKKSRPKICFVGTASGDAQGYIDRFYSAFKKYECEPTHLSLFKGKFSNLREFILSQDIIYVGGGNTKNMLTLWKEWGLDRILYEAYLNGIVLAGISAGAICWFEQMLTDSVPGQLTMLNGLGWLKGFCIPHFDGEAERMPSTIKAIETKALRGNGWGIDDGAAVHYIDEEWSKVVCSHPDKSAQLFVGGDSTANIIESSYLGGEATLIRRAAIADAEQIHNAHMQSIREVCSKDHTEAEIAAWGNRPFNKEQRESSIKNDFVWVIEAAGAIQGYSHLKLFEKDGLKQGHILGLYLTPRILGKKLGQRMVSLMIEQAKEFCAQRITLESTISAHSFYGRNGFHDVGPMIAIKINNQDVRCYPMELDLSGKAERSGSIHHVEIYVSNLKTSLDFWSWFLMRLGYFEYQSWEQGKSYKKGETYIVFVQTEQKYKDVPYHRCRTGLNHIAFHASSEKMVDQITHELRERKVSILYEDKHPRAGGKSYGVYFEDPDRIKIELVAP
ncbi:MAG: GNAT family N-acetyltransferase [Pseudobdellovibrionaceae bacterium]